MGCPMFEKKVQIQTPTEYPFIEQYRPLSWIVSSSANIAIFLILMLICYALYKRSKNQRKGLGKTPFRMVKGDQKEGITEGDRLVKALVTGGCGCLGKRLIQALVKDGGYEIHCLDLFIPEEESRPSGVTSFVSVDIGDRESLELAMDQLGELDVIFHVAGLIPKVHTRDSDLYQVNKSGTQYLLDICKANKVKRFIYTSTADVLLSNNKKDVLDEVTESWPVPKVSLNAYCASKKEAEEIVIKSNGHNGIVTCSLRCASLGHPDSSVFRELFHIRGMYIGNGMNKHSAVDIDQCALAHVLAEKKLREGAESPVAGAIYHLSGDSFTYKELMEYSPDDSGVTIWGQPRPLSIPKWVFTVLAFINVATYQLTGYAPVSASVDMSSVHFLSLSYSFNGKKAMKELGWPEQPSWKETVEKIVNEYEERLENKKSK